MPATDRDAWTRWHAAAAEPAVDEALRTLYADVDAEIAARSPTCWQSGKCCAFDTYGHRLYVTALEAAWCIAQPISRATINTPRDAGPLVVLNDAPSHDACIFQRDKQCGVHPVRPLGCRIYFCQQGTQQWQAELYESFQQRLRELHTTHDIPYQYLEWRTALREAQ